MWLEIADNIVIGVHSDRCDNKNTWVEYEGEAKPGDSWQDNRVVSIPKMQNSVRDKRIEARNRITAFYPQWKQLNILREGDPNTINKMGAFIDACREWSNDLSSSIDQLEQITP